MNEIIQILGPSWTLTITYRFFPCSKATMKKLFKYIDMDYANVRRNYYKLYEHLNDYVSYGGDLIFNTQPRAEQKKKMIRENYIMVLDVVRKRGYT